MQVSTIMPFNAIKWEEFNNKSIVNLYRNNQSRNKFYGPLGSLKVSQIEYMNENNVLMPYLEDFYIWTDNTAIEKWRAFKKATSKTYTKGENYRVTNADVIESAINGKLSINPRYYTNFISIDNIEISQQERKEIIPMFKDYGSYLQRFYDDNNIPESIYNNL